MVGITNQITDALGASDVLVKAGHGIIKRVFVTLKGSSGDKMVLKDGTTGSGSVITTIHGEDTQNMVWVDVPFVSGLYADFTGTTARYIIAYE